MENTKSEFLTNNPITAKGPQALSDVFGAIQRFWKALHFKVTETIEQGNRPVPTISKCCRREAISTVFKSTSGLLASFSKAPRDFAAKTEETRQFMDQDEVRDLLLSATLTGAGNDRLNRGLEQCEVLRTTLGEDMFQKLKPTFPFIALQLASTIMMSLGENLDFRLSHRSGWSVMNFARRITWIVSEVEKQGGREYYKELQSILDPLVKLGEDGTGESLKQIVFRTKKKQKAKVLSAR